MDTTTEDNGPIGSLSFQPYLKYRRQMLLSQPHKLAIFIAQEWLSGLILLFIFHGIHGIPVWMLWATFVVTLGPWLVWAAKHYSLVFGDPLLRPMVWCTPQAATAIVRAIVCKGRSDSYDAVMIAAMLLPVLCLLLGMVFS